MRVELSLPEVVTEPRMRLTLHADSRDGVAAWFHCNGLAPF
jgi:hypothetical protein